MISSIVNGRSKAVGIRYVIGEYLSHLAVLRYSPYSLRSNRYELATFRRWCEIHGVDDFREVTRDTIQEYLGYLHRCKNKKSGKPLTGGRMCQMMGPVRGLFRYLSRENKILFNPTLEVELPRVEKRLPGNILSVEETEQIMNTINTGTDLGIRNRTMVEVLYSTGLRRLELLRLRVQDIDRGRGIVRVREGKGRKDRVVPIGERALRWVERYLYEVWPKLALHQGETILFLTDEGRPYDHNALSLLVRKYIRLAGINKPGSCHLFRHAFATHLLEAGVDVRYIQAMMGHARLESTMIYTKVSIGKLKELHAKHHPGKMLRVDESKVGG